MVRRSSGWIWVGRTVAVVMMAGLAGYLYSVGLDKADKLASALGLLVAVFALVAPYLLPASPSPELARSSGLDQLVANAVVGGNLTQARNTVGKVDVAPTAGPVTAPPVAPTAGPVPEPKDGQYVNGVWVGGNLTQVDGAGGDVTLG